MDGLLKGSRADFATKFDELIIVPDGLLWYVPFEALQVQVDGQLRPLISRFRIRYAPTAGLATATSDLGRRRGNTAIVVGKFSPKLDDDAVAEHGQGPVEIAARLRDAEDAPAGLGPDLRQFHRPPRGARRAEPGRRDRSLRLVAASHGADQDSAARWANGSSCRGAGRTK